MSFILTELPWSRWQITHGAGEQCCIEIPRNTEVVEFEYVREHIVRLPPEEYCTALRKHKDSWVHLAATGIEHNDNLQLDELPSRSRLISDLMQSTTPHLVLRAGVQRCTVEYTAVYSSCSVT